MPSKIPSSRRVIYLQTLGDTDDASLAAARAGVSRTWAYKRRKADARFDALCREMVARFRRTPPRSEPPHPPTAEAAGPSLSREGRGAGKRVQVRRDRIGEWTADKEARFVERMRETCSAWLASALVGLSAGSAYERRKRRPTFAAAWDEAEREGWPPIDQPWIESAICFFEGREPPPDNPVRITSIDEVLEAMRGNRFAPRRPRARGPRRG